MPSFDPMRSTTITRHHDGQAAPSFSEDFVAVEEPLEIRVHGRSLAVVMRTPGNDRELVAGFLWTEGLIRHRGDILDLVYCREGETDPRGNVMDTHLAPQVTLDWERLKRHTFASSSCGLCGKASIDAVRQAFPPIKKEVEFAPLASLIAALPEKLRAAQRTFSVTGGLHASGLFNPAGELLALREDVGRHNALDKIVGQAFFAEQLPLDQTILLVSGRVSFELMQKALAAGIPLVAAISAPTSLAVDFARESGQTLVGFVRDERMNVYAGTLTG